MKTNVKQLSLGIGVAVLVGLGMPVPAFATGGVPPAAPVSAQGRPQVGPRTQPERSLPAMGPVEPALVKGRLLRMDPDAKVIVPGARQMEPVTAEARSPRQGQGPQVGRVAEARGADSYLHLVLRVTEGGAVDVVDATEHPGTVVLSDVVEGAYLQEVTLGGKTVAVESIADPFQVRSFARPGAQPEHGEGHAFGRANSVLLTVRVPGMTLKSAAAQDVGFALYRPREQLHGRLDAGVLEQLKRESRVEPSLRTSGRALSDDIARKGRRVEQ